MLPRCLICRVCGSKVSNLSKFVIRSVSTLPKAKPNFDEFPNTEKDPNISKLENEVPIIPGVCEVVPKTNDSYRWQKITSGPSGLLDGYLQLSKHRLTMLITTTALAGVMVSPGVFSWSVLGGCLVGTTLMSASANAGNQLLEAPYDAQMRRTQSRVLVINRISPLHAFLFANFTGWSGFLILWLTCNPITAWLGLLNIFLYVTVYTPMKRYHIGCTWVGAIVGSIPPLMGYTSLTGTLDAGAAVLAAILFSWQFPHFNGLSWNLRGDYSRAGYRVMCVTNEDLCRKTTIRHAVSLLGLCSVAAPLCNLTSLNFAFYSIPLNAIMVYMSYKFYKNPDAKTSRNLFFYSLIYLPSILLLLSIGNWCRFHYSDLGKRDNAIQLTKDTLPGCSIRNL